MLLLFWCLLVDYILNVECTARCGIGDEWSFMPTEDGVHGRYRLEWCPRVELSSSTTRWSVSVRYNSNRNFTNCQLSSNKIYNKGIKHSEFEEDVVHNCTNVCFSTNFDLIFSDTCYSFQTVLSNERYDYIYYVSNNYTSENFTHSKIVTYFYTTGDHVIADWFLNLVPAANYVMWLCPPTETKQECENVTKNCTTPWTNRTKISCELWPQLNLEYQLKLEHRAPWCSGEKPFAKIRAAQFPLKLQAGVAKPNNFFVPTNWWVVGVMLTLVLCVATVLLVWHCRRATKLRERALIDLDSRRQAVATSIHARGSKQWRGRVLLLYARDCEHMMAVGAQMRALLHHSVDHVYDLYSKEVVSASARAPGEWVRRVMASPDVRVVLVQSRAAAYLHAPDLLNQTTTGVPILVQPLLNRRVAYRVPHSSDTLLSLALRLLADSVCTRRIDNPYKKFYIATIYGLEAELVRDVTPNRRYSLPGAAQLLLRDLCDGAAMPDDELVATDIQKLTKAIADLHEYVKANPTYLDDGLIFFD